jgi:hypothetical protein
VVVDFNRSSPQIHHVSNVMKERIGDELSLKILLDGKPLKSVVQPPTTILAGAIIPTLMQLKLGRWSGICKSQQSRHLVVRVGKRIEEPTKDYDLYSLKAILVFAVQ